MGEQPRGSSGNQWKNYFKGAGGDLGFISVYAPTAESKESEKDKFYDDLARTAESVQGCLVYVRGYFNARIYERNKHYEE